MSVLTRRDIALSWLHLVVAACWHYVSSLLRHTSTGQTCRLAVVVAPEEVRLVVVGSIVVVVIV